MADQEERETEKERERHSDTSVEQMAREVAFAQQEQDRLFHNAVLASRVRDARIAEQQRQAQAIRDAEHQQFLQRRAVIRNRRDIGNP